MKKWAFVSDFDGTITNQDFYSIVIEKYYPQGRNLYKKWKAGQILDIDFLRAVFAEIHQDEAQIIEDIFSIPIDKYVPSFIKQVQESGGDFYILSAGTDYYIHHLLNRYAIDNVIVIANEGFYHEKNIHLNIDEKHPHYSQRYGIDKAKVIEYLKGHYDKVYFIGDSEPDSHPASYADVTYAKDALQEILEEKEIPFVPVTTFKEVEEDLKAKGVLA
ncbi:MtnX-like HAD-IB family phosphatase [Bacillaceae bacterium IKA-2]|nr:MtnX-like HAD-IB family phosphatase [Bacillaceae bacterium IKA-2]